MELPALSHNINPDIPNVPLAADTLLQDRYRIVRQLGRGGMGAVYEAVDQRLGITVALKETLSAEESMRKQFEREARLLAGMQHPALPRVSDHFVEGHRAFLVMQFIGGVDLAKIISQQPGPFPRDQVIAWADQLLDALIYLHSRDRQVIHRDIKPHNLKLTATGQIALLDFGLAKAQPSDPSVTASHAFFGYTRHYAPLEQIQDQRTDPRSDIYALGATLYHLLTGIKPPDAMVRAAAVVNGGPDPLQPADKIHPAVGPQIAAILNKALAQKPEERYENAGEFREALRRMGRTKETGLVPSRVSQDSSAGHRGKVHISEITRVRVPETSGVNMALVASARRFGPAGATAVLLLVIGLTAGILYGAQTWFPDSGKLSSTKAASETAAAMRDSTSGRKPRASETAAAVAPKVRNNEAATNRTTERSSEFATTAPVEKTCRGTACRAPTTQEKAAALKTSDRSIRGEEARSGAARKTLPRPGAPSIRFPKPDFRENAPAPTPVSRLRVHDSLNASAAASLKESAPNAPPQFFRAADGTRIVKFSDGSTRLIRPGAREASFIR
ncbi:MAG TPA: protein kinase [Pyrinomonadaceae bacterium]|jgi:serine/threonine protein kinase